jgi:hypothetical protein
MTRIGSVAALSAALAFIALPAAAQQGGSMSKQGDSMKMHQDSMGKGKAGDKMKNDMADKKGGKMKEDMSDKMKKK